MDNTLSTFNINLCLPCSAISQTVEESKELDEDFKKQFKAIQHILPRLTAREMYLLLSSSPLNDVFTKKYHSVDIVTYEAIIAMTSAEELENYNQQESPIADSIALLQRMADGKRNASPEVTSTSSVRLFPAAAPQPPLDKSIPPSPKPT